MKPGPRPLADVPATAVITIRVTPDVAAELRIVAAENQTTRASVIRDAVAEYVADYRERPIPGLRTALSCGG